MPCLLVQANPWQASIPFHHLPIPSLASDRWETNLGSQIGATRLVRLSVGSLPYPLLSTTCLTFTYTTVEVSQNQEGKMELHMMRIFQSPRPHVQLVQCSSWNFFGRAYGQNHDRNRS